MFNRSCLPSLAAALMLAGGLPAASAQTIERIKLTDNDLSCAQIHAEAQQMDAAIQLAGPGLPVAAAPAAVPAPTPAGIGAPTLAQMHAPTAALMTQQGVSQTYQQEYARVMSQVQSGNRGAAVAPAALAPAAAGLAGMVGSLFGGAAQPAAQPQQVAVAPTAASAGLGAQAKARKDHLTGLFLSKGCKMSDLK